MESSCSPCMRRFVFAFQTKIAWSAPNSSEASPMPPVVSYALHIVHFHPSARNSAAPCGVQQPQLH
eukprot:6230011-Amphidinium_carterae.1